MTRGTLAIVDDDPLLTGYYVRELSDAGYDVAEFRSPASCRTALNGGDKFDLFLCDLMMPPRGAFPVPVTEYGLITGLLFVQELRERDPETPVFLFTNLNVKAVIERVANRLDDLPNVFLLPKAEFPPARMLEAISAMLDHSTPPSQRRGILKRLFDALILQPTFFGLGVNLKRLVDGHDPA